MTAPEPSSAPITLRPAAEAPARERSLIELTEVTRRYEIGGHVVTALRDVDLTIGGGEFVVVLGPSGSGRTTFLKLIGALDSPSAGRIVIGGQDISGRPWGSVSSRSRSRRCSRRGSSRA